MDADHRSAVVDNSFMEVKTTENKCLASGRNPP